MSYYVIFKKILQFSCKLIELKTFKGSKDKKDANVTLEPNETFDNPCSTWNQTADNNQLLELEVCKCLLYTPHQNRFKQKVVTKAKDNSEFHY